MPKFSANLSCLYQDLAFLDRFAAAAKDGFGALEYLGPYAEPKEKVADALALAGAQVRELRLREQAPGPHPQVGHAADVRVDDQLPDLRGERVLPLRLRVLPGPGLRRAR